MYATTRAAPGVAVAALLALTACEVAKAPPATAAVSTPITVTITTTPPATLAACGTLAFAATVANSTGSTAVTWSVQEGATGGTFTGGNVYHAPATGGTWHVVATSVQDTGKTDSVPVTTLDEVIQGVLVSPSAPYVAPGDTQFLTASIVTSCGRYPATTALELPGAGAPR